MVQAVVKGDTKILQDVMNELKWDSRIDARDIVVTVEQGVVELTGTVPSYIQKVAAQEAAHRVWGVLDVANDISVQLPGTVRRTDAEIAHAVRIALEMDVLVPHEHIQSTVSDGWVTLEGAVDLWRQFEDAERVVRHLAGVLGIANKIKVTPSEATPDQVHTAIEEAIARQAERTAERIQVAVCDGMVTVVGKVRSWQEKHAVLSAVKHAPGVHSVTDNLLVDPLV